MYRLVFLLLLLLLFATDSAIAQSRCSLGMTSAMDYMTVPDAAKDRQEGYNNQFAFRYGFKALVRIGKRFSVGTAIELYRRRGSQACIYYPGPDDPPAPFLVPIYNDPSYECQFSSTTKSSRLDIPILFRYQLYNREELDVFIEAGAGYQSSTRYQYQRTDLSNGTSIFQDYKSTVLLSRVAPQMNLGMSRRLSDRFSVSGSLFYRTDDFSFAYQTYGLVSTLFYHF